MIPSVDSDIRRARTLPRSFATDAAWRARVRDDVLARAWHAVPADIAARDEAVVPWTLLPGCLDEPLVETRDAGVARTLSNVCTHRAHLVALDPRDDVERLRCRYHGRCFDLDGRFESAPGFDGPADGDDLAQVARAAWGPLTFVALDPDVDFETWITPARRWLAGCAAGPEHRDASRDRAYDVAAEWLLYVDNYLEGFHVPFVHPGLSRAIDLERYRTELDGDGVVQWAAARDDEDALVLPPDHPLAAERVAAIYLWLFPNLMLNLYPWGLSVNVVEPRDAGRCRVRFETWVTNPALLDRGAGADLHQVELEDEAVVERVQQGARARLGPQRGRYAPAEERGVHHFHRTLVERLAGAAP